MGLIRKAFYGTLLVGALGIGVVYSSQIKGCAESKSPGTEQVLEEGSKTFGEKVKGIFYDNPCSLAEDARDLETDISKTYEKNKEDIQTGRYGVCIEDTLKSFEQGTEYLSPQASPAFREQQYQKAVGKVEAGLQDNPEYANQLVLKGLEVLAQHPETGYDSSVQTAMLDVLVKKAEETPQIMMVLGPKAKEEVCKGAIKKFYDDMAGKVRDYFSNEGPTQQ